MNLSKLDKILDYHPEDFDVKVQPGVTRQKLDHFLKSDGVWFPIDPGIHLLTHLLTQNYLHNQKLGIFKKTSDCAKDYLLTQSAIRNIKKNIALRKICKF